MTRLKLAVLACAILSSAAFAEVRSFGPGIRVDAAPTAGPPAKATAPVRGVRIDRAALHAAVAAGRLELPSTGAQPLVARNLHERRRDDGLLVWTGTVDTRFGPQSFVLTLGDGVAFGTVPQYDGHPLRVETRHGAIVLAEGPLEREIEQTEPDFALPPEPTAADREERRRQEEQKADGAAVVDVLVLYTPRLVTVWGSQAAAMARLAYLEESTNQQYVDSQMAMRIRVVGRHLVDHMANDDNSDALELMSSGADSAPLRREAVRMRAMYGADLVMLVREASRNSQTSCGVAYLNGYRGGPFKPERGFGVSADRGMGYAGCDLTFSHEIGHNLGAHHDIETTQGLSGAYPYSRGWKQTIDAASGFGTIMAYEVFPQVTIGRFSNPRQSDCMGRPCGDAATADNARGQDEASPLVAAMIPAIVAGGEPALGVGDVVVAEGNPGFANARFTLTLSAAPTAPVDVVLATMPGSAVAGDFVALQRTVRFAAGQTSAVVDVQVRGDLDVEIDEAFALNVISATGVRIADGQGVATITNDEATPTLSIADAALSEGDAGTAVATFTASLSAPSAAPVTFAVANHQFKVFEAAHPATLEEDVHEVRITGLTIAAGQTSVQFSMPVVGDTTEEEDETFYVLADSIVGARHGDINATATIIDDDSMAGPLPARPTVSIADAQVQEGNTGTVVATFAVTLSAPASTEVRFGAGTRDGTAIAGADYTALALSSASIPAGGTTADVVVTVRGDTLDESDEEFAVELTNLVGAALGDGTARGLIRDDDGSADTPVLAARDDRWVLLENSPNTRLEVLANDVFTESRMRGGSVSIVEQPVRGEASVYDNGTATAGDDVIIYRPDVGGSGEDVVSYRACEATGRCVEAFASIVLRPHLDIDIEPAEASGYRDFEFHNLQAMPDARFEMGWYMVEGRAVELDLAVDPTPESPWDGGRTGTAYSLLALPADEDDGYVYTRTASLLVEAAANGDIDLYLGFDDNRNGAPDRSELRCTSAMHANKERCEASVFIDDKHTQAWVMVHNRATGPVRATTRTFDDTWDFDTTASVVVTGPGTLPAGARFPMRFAWDVLISDYDRLLYVGLRDTPGAPLRRFPVVIRGGGPADEYPNIIFPGLDTTYGWVPPRRSVKRLYVEVPAGIASMRLNLRAGIQQPLEFHVARAGTPATPEITDAPPTSADVFSAAIPVDTTVPVVIDTRTHGTGRWYVTVVNASDETSSYSVSAEFDQPLPPLPVVRPGSYFNPNRSGHGLLIYPAGDVLAGLWYTYLQDGTPTWYYLQGGAPHGYGEWYAGIYRGAWNGTANHQVEVGRARIVSGADGGLVFHYSLDSEYGAEQLSPLGRGCPQLAGAPLDVSSHWFNPARSGTGYSVQMWNNYEFYAAFVYDAWGVPRFLTAESPRFAGADAVLQLDQLHGFCPLCTRTGNPTRFDVGNLRRRFANGTFAGIELDAIWTDGVPGAWTANETIQILGGPGTTQGCQP